MAIPRNTATDGLPELRADAARNRERVVRIAREQVAAGDTSLAMNAIAKLAEVGVGTVYRHFPTRQTLLEAVAEESLQAIVREAAQVACEPAADIGLHRLLAYALNLLLSDAGFAAVLASPTFECVRTLKLSADLATSIETVLGRARAAGAIRADVTADDIRRLVCGLRFALLAGNDGLEQTDRYTAILLAGLRP